MGSERSGNRDGQTERSRIMRKERKEGEMIREGTCRQRVRKGLERSRNRKWITGDREEQTKLEGEEGEAGKRKDMCGRKKGRKGGR